jgi:hypothetical protein
MKVPTDGEFTAFIGIDWADAKHDICLQPADGKRRRLIRFRIGSTVSRNGPAPCTDASVAPSP